MSNKRSKAFHIPIRTCVVCKNKIEKSNLIRFVVIDDEVVYDMNNKFSAKGRYFCKNCVEKYTLWLKKYKKKRK